MLRTIVHLLALSTLSLTIVSHFHSCWVHMSLMVPILSPLGDKQVSPHCTVSHGLEPLPPSPPPAVVHRSAYVTNGANIEPSGFSSVFHVQKSWLSATLTYSTSLMDQLQIIYSFFAEMLVWKHTALTLNLSLLCLCLIRFCEGLSGLLITTCFTAILSCFGYLLFHP